MNFATTINTIDTAFTAAETLIKFALALYANEIESGKLIEEVNEALTTWQALSQKAWDNIRPLLAIARKAAIKGLRYSAKLAVAYAELVEQHFAETATPATQAIAVETESNDEPTVIEADSDDPTAIELPGTIKTEASTIVDPVVLKTVEPTKTAKARTRSIAKTRNQKAKGTPQSSARNTTRKEAPAA